MTRATREPTNERAWLTRTSGRPGYGHAARKTHSKTGCRMISSPLVMRLLHCLAPPPEDSRAGAMGDESIVSIRTVSFACTPGQGFRVNHPVIATVWLSRPRTRNW